MKKYYSRLLHIISVLIRVRFKFKNHLSRYRRELDFFFFFSGHAEIMHIISGYFITVNLRRLAYVNMVFGEFECILIPVPTGALVQKNIFKYYQKLFSGRIFIPIHYEEGPEARRTLLLFYHNIIILYCSNLIIIFFFFRNRYVSIQSYYN